VHGPAVEALAALGRVLTVEMNAAAENPLINAAGEEVLHNGNFHGAYLARALDSARLALCADASLSQARLAALVGPHRAAAVPGQRAGRQLRRHDRGVHRQLGARRDALPRCPGLARQRGAVPGRGRTCGVLRFR
jgi:hypothetical protein